MTLEHNIINFPNLDNSDFGRFLQIENLTETEKTYEPIEYCCLNLGDWNTEPNAFIDSENFSTIMRSHKRHNKSKWALAVLLALRFPKMRFPKLPKLKAKHKALKNKKSISEEVLFQKSKLLNPQMFPDMAINENMHLHEKPAMNEVFYDNRRKALSIDNSHQKHYGAHATAMVSVLALFAISSQNFIPTLSTDRGLKQLEQIQQQLTVSQTQNNALTEEINKLKAETTARQNAINAEGTTLLGDIASGSKTIEQVLAELQAKINEQNDKANSHAPKLNVSLDTAKKLLEKMTEGKDKLLTNYTKEVTQELSKQNKKTKEKIDSILSSTSGAFANLPEGAKTAVTEQIDQLNKDIAKDTEAFSTQLTKDIETYKKELEMVVSDAKASGMSVEVLAEVYTMADQELKAYIDAETAKNTHKLLTQTRERQGKAVTTLLESALQGNQQDIINKIKGESIPEETKKILQSLLDGMINGDLLPKLPDSIPLPNNILSGTNPNTPKTQPETKDPQETKTPEAQYSRKPIDSIENELKKKKSEAEEFYKGGMYGWCQAQDGGWSAWLRHISTVGVCSVYTGGYNIAGNSYGYGVDWDGIFNIVNAMSVVFDVVAVVSGFGAITAVAKTAARVGTAYALKTAAKTVGAQVLKTGLMTGIGGGIGLAVGETNEAMMQGAAMGATFALGTIKKGNLVARAMVGVAAKKALKGASLVKKANTIGKIVKINATSTVKGIASQAVKAGAGAFIGAGVAGAAGIDKSRGALVGAALVTPIISASRGAAKLAQTKQAQKIIAQVGAKVFNKAPSALNM